MPRKRKIATAPDSEMMPPPPVPPATTKSKKGVKNVEAKDSATVGANQHRPQPLEVCPVSVIFEKAQTNESLHVKYFKELNNIYEKRMDHGRFMGQFLKGLRVWMKFDESNVFANLGLKFCAKYLTSLNDDAAVDTHPILVSTFDFLLNTVSLTTTIRFRLCQFVNLLLSFMGSEAALDDVICNNIMKYMLDRLKDLSAAVRVQAVQALQRLQTPDNPNDKIVRSYLFHLANDPSSAVRMAIVTAVGRNFHTIPSILDRLWDIDERVRRHTYLQMSSFPVKSYKVVQRVIFLEQGLNDDSDGVRKVVTSVLLPQWLQSYQRKYIAFVSALKLDANESEIKRFVKITKQALFVIFKNESTEKLIEALPLTPDGGEFEKCVPFEKLTMEITVYWLALIEYLQSIGVDGDENSLDDGEDHVQNVICELSTFCNYLTKFFNYIAEMEQADADQWVVQENRYKFMTLIDILLTFDLGDEIGRKNLKEFIGKVLSTRTLEEETIRKLVCCVENLMPDTEQRLQFFVDIIRMYTDPSEVMNDFSETYISQMLDVIKDPNLRMKITNLRLNVLDLREQESIATQNKDYERVEKITEELAAYNEKFSQIVCQVYPEQSSTINSSLKLDAKKMPRESTLQCLQIFFYAVASKHTSTLTPNMCQLYKDFVRRQIESKHMSLRDWALKCGIACSMLYEQLAKDAYNRLTDQFYKHHNTFIWTTSIKGAFELIDKYGFDYFDQDGDVDKNVPKAKKTRQLYNTLGYLDEQPDDEDGEQSKQGRDIIFLFAHFMETCDETSIMKALITGFCRLVLSGKFQTGDLVSKLMLKFFSPATDPEINQTLAIFFQALIKRQQQECLAKALLPTLFIILDAPNDSPLQEVKPESVIKFVVNSTMPAYCSPGLNIHNDIALQFLSVMNDNSGNKDLLKLLSKELLTLQVSDDSSLRDDLQSVSDNLLDRTIDPKTETYIKDFKEILAGTYKGTGTRTTDVQSPSANTIEDENGSVDDRDGEEQDQDQEAAVDNDEVVENGLKNPEMVTSTQKTTSEAASVLETSNINNVSGIALPESENSLALPPSDENESTTNGAEPPAEQKKPMRGKTNPKENEKLTKAPAAKPTRNAIQSKRTPTPPAASDGAASSSSSSDDDNDENETVPGTPKTQVARVITSRKVFDQKNNNSLSRTPPKKSTTVENSPKRLKEKNVKVTPAVNHRLSRAVVKVTRLRLDVNDNSSHRTRNARVAEFKQANVMTRNRLSVDRIKSPTQRIEHLKKIAPFDSDANGSASIASSSRSSSRKSSVSSNNISSPRRTNGLPPPVNGRQSNRRDSSSSSAPSTPIPRRKPVQNGPTKSIEITRMNGLKRDRTAMLRPNTSQTASDEQTGSDTRSPRAKRRADKTPADKSTPLVRTRAPSLRRTVDTNAQKERSSSVSATKSETVSQTGTRSTRSLNNSLPANGRTNCKKMDRSLPATKMGLRKRK